MILFFNSMFRATVDESQAGNCRLTSDRRMLSVADAVVFHIPTMREPFPEKRPGQLWVAWSMESDVNYPQQRDPEYMDRFDLRMTYHLDSDVLASYMQGSSSERTALRTMPRTKEGLVTLFVSSPLNRSRRAELARELMNYLEVHSFGKRLTNREMPGEDLGRESKLDLMARYKFDLSFENAIDHDYVTEKFYEPLLVGTLPVYLGAPNIDQFAPGDRCFINVNDFANARELADYLLHLDADDAAYADYFAWKSQAFRPAFMDMVNRQSIPVFERLCEVVESLLG